jgi:hypothetical protein
MSSSNKDNQKKRKQDSDIRLHSKSVNFTLKIDDWSHDIPLDAATKLLALNQERNNAVSKLATYKNNELYSLKRVNIIEKKIKLFKDNKSTTFVSQTVGFTFQPFKAHNRDNQKKRKLDSDIRVYSKSEDFTLKIEDWSDGYSLLDSNKLLELNQERNNAISKLANYKNKELYTLKCVNIIEKKIKFVKADKPIFHGFGSTSSFGV